MRFNSSFFLFSFLLLINSIGRERTREAEDWVAEEKDEEKKGENKTTGYSYWILLVLYSSLIAMVMMLVLPERLLKHALEKIKSLPDGEPQQHRKSESPFPSLRNQPSSLVIDSTTTNEDGQQM